MLRAACPTNSGCTLISNYPTADALAIVDGGMDERGGCDPGTIELLQSMSRQGKLLQYHPQDPGRSEKGSSTPGSPASSPVPDRTRTATSTSFWMYNFSHFPQLLHHLTRAV